MFSALPPALRRTAEERIENDTSTCDKATRGGVVKQRLYPAGGPAGRGLCALFDNDPDLVADGFFSGNG